VPTTAGRKAAAKRKPRRPPCLKTHGPRVAAFSERFIRQTKGRWAGQPLHLEPWQRALLDELYLLDPTGGLLYREALIGVARKNGKSTLAAAIALYGLIASGENAPEVYSAAASKEQARVVFGQAKAFVEASPLLMDWLRPMRDVIVCPANDGVYRVLSSDAPLQHGLNPSVVVIDELHAHRDPELYYALTTGQLARENPLVVSITTAGFDRESICHQVYARGRDVAQGGAEAMRAERFLFRWFQADERATLDDEATWRAANPSSWIDLEDLRRERRRLPEHVFRRLHLNQWTTSEDHWLPPGAWEDCLADAPEDAVIPRGAPVTLGVDLGLKHDKAAVVVVHKTDITTEDGLPCYAVRAHVIDPPGGGVSLSIGDVEQQIRDLAREFDVQQVLYDPWRFERSAQLLGDEGLLMVEHPMSNERMAPASERLYEAVIERRIIHDGDATLAAHVAAGVTVDTERGWRLTKRKAKDFVDALMALVIAFNAAETVPVKAPFDPEDHRIVPLWDTEKT
jgi:phage terminase large subunit-like protein